LPKSGKQREKQREKRRASSLKRQIQKTKSIEVINILKEQVCSNCTHSKTWGKRSCQNPFKIKNHKSTEAPEIKTCRLWKLSTNYKTIDDWRKERNRIIK
jgi:hypothetical protein